MPDKKCDICGYIHEGGHYQIKVKSTNCGQLYPKPIELPYGFPVKDWLAGIDGSVLCVNEVVCSNCGVFDVTRAD